MNLSVCIGEMTETPCTRDVQQLEIEGDDSLSNHQGLEVRLT